MQLIYKAKYMPKILNTNIGHPKFSIGGNQIRSINNSGGGIFDAAAAIIYGFSVVLLRKTTEKPFF